MSLTNKDELRDDLFIDAIEVFGYYEDTFRDFTAQIKIIEADDDPVVIGKSSGWIGWHIEGEDIWYSADAIDSDAATLGAAASEIIEWLEENGDVWIDTILFIDRVKLKKQYRGHRLVRTIIERLIDFLRLNRDSTLVVLQPEPQQEQGGPYPVSPVRDAALAKLRAAHDATGLQQWRDSDVWWLPGDLVPELAEQD